MIEGQDIVVVSGEFGRYPSSIEHLIRQFLPKNRILWVEMTGMRRPNLSFYDLKRAVSKVKRLALGASVIEASSQKLPKSLRLTSPVTIPFPELSLARNFNDRALLKQIKKCTAELGFKNYGLITTLPMAAGVVPRAGAAWSIYYCPDEWALWPGMNQNLIRTWEAALLKAVNAVVVPSKHLQQSKGTASKPASIVHHGVDVDHFRQAQSATREKRVTFFGLFDDRMDQKLLEFLGGSLPDCLFEMIGPVQCKLNPALLKDQFVWPGPVPYQQLPGMLQQSQVLILPYLQNELTRNINPLKARECLATGKPVIAMRLPELEQLPGVLLADSHQQFLSQLIGVLSGRIKHQKKDVENALAECSWTARASELSAIILQLNGTFQSPLRC